MSVLAIAGLAVTAMFAVSSAPEPDFVYRSGRTLMLHGHPFRFVGFNAYGMEGCATGKPWTHGQLETYFSSLPRAAVTRTWAFEPWGTHTLDDIVATAAEHGQKLILSLADGPDNCEDIGSPHDGAGASERGAGKPVEWYRSGFKTAYLPWVRTVVARYAESPAIAMWEIMNEPGSGGDVPSDTVASFLDQAAAEIKRVDPRHLVESGTLAPYLRGTDDFALVHRSRYIDVGSLHEYDYDYNDSKTIVSGHLDPALSAMAAINKPLIVGETGITSGANGCGTSLTNRAAADRAKFDAYFRAGVAGVLVWDYDPTPPAGCGYGIGLGDPLIAVLRGYRPPPAAAPWSLR